ncbi:MAG TPA: hypothetical protein VIK72_11250 [Clostridiaceae bacterium]
MKIEGYFKGVKDADRAVEKLKEAGYRKVYSYLNDHYSDEPNYWDNNPYNNGFSVTNVVMNPNSYTSGGGPGFGPIGFPGPILGAVTAVTGGKGINNVNYKVVVETEAMEEEKVKQIMYELGAELRDPNFRRESTVLKGSED